MVGFAELAYFASIKENKVEIIIYIALGGTLWNIVDVIVGIGLVISIFINQQKIEK